jgi:hypothetical protein
MPPLFVGRYEGEHTGIFSTKQRARRCACGALVRVGYAIPDEPEMGLDTFTVKERVYKDSTPTLETKP